MSFDPASLRLTRQDHADLALVQRAASTGAVTTEEVRLWLLDLVALMPDDTRPAWIIRALDLKAGYALSDRAGFVPDPRHLNHLQEAALDAIGFLRRLDPAPGFGRRPRDIAMDALDQRPDIATCLARIMPQADLSAVLETTE